MGIGTFWIPESAVGHNWSNFKPFRLKFGLCTWFLGISTWKTANSNLGQFFPLLGHWPFLGPKNYEVSKLLKRMTIWFEIWQFSLWLWYLKGGRVLNSQFCPLMGLWELANFGSQKVRSVINWAIFNRSASNLVCTHYYLVSPPDKQERPIWGQFVSLLGYWPFLWHKNYDVS